MNLGKGYVGGALSGSSLCVYASTPYNIHAAGEGGNEVHRAGKEMNNANTKMQTPIALFQGKI